MAYSEKLLDHFKKPKNVGTLNKDKKYAWDRWWDQDFNLWYNSGCASDDLMPGDHPNPNHEWNTNRQAMIERLIGNDGEESY